jgi:hypothetical protein
MCGIAGVVAARDRRAWCILRWQRLCRAAAPTVRGAAGKPLLDIDALRSSIFRRESADGLGGRVGGRRLTAHLHPPFVRSSSVWEPDTEVLAGYLQWV